MNEKEAEVVSLKKGLASEVGNDSLIAENSDLRVVAAVAADA